MTSFKHQNNVTPSIAITDVTFDHFSVAIDVIAVRAFRTVTLLFHIIRFFSIGSIGKVCSNYIFDLLGDDLLLLVSTLKEI